MAGLSSVTQQLVPATLIQRLKSEKQVLVAENVINQNGLHWSPSKSSDTVFISGSNEDVLDFAVEYLQSLLDQSRNPLCSFLNRRLHFIFKGTLGKKILESEKILKEKCMYVFVYGSTYLSEVDVKCGFDDYSRIRKTIDQIRSSTPSSTDSSNLLDKSVVGGRSQYNGHPGSSSTPLVHFQRSKFQYSFKTNNIHVYVYKASITDVTGIDAIVNAANEDLLHESGVAYTICVAAGSSVKNQCSDHLSKHGRVPVGDNCVTGPGNLMHLKAIIHAVGPRWDDYTEKKKCAMTLHETVIHALRTAHTKSLHKIALPSISAGIFKVPKDLCAEMYIKAVMDYSRDAKPNSVTEIHFVDVKDDILKAIREAHEKWKKSPELLDFKNALKHAPPKGGAGARPLGRSHSNSVRGAKETGKKLFDDAQLKTRSEQLYKNTCASSSTSSEKDTEEIKLEQKLRDLEVKKIAMIIEKRKKKLEERIRQAQENLTVLSVLVGQTGYRFPTGTKQEQSNKSTPPMSSSAFEKDREEIELEQKLRELEEKKVIAVKERRKKELKERIKQLEEDLSVTEAVPAEDTEEEDKKRIFCTDVLRNPQKLGCGHEFCSKCSGEAFEYQEACPVCGTKFGDDADNQQGLSSDALLSWYNSSDFIKDS